MEPTLLVVSVVAFGGTKGQAMNRLMTFGVFVLALLPAACTKSPSVPPSSVQSGAAQSPSTQSPSAQSESAQVPASPWSLKSETDKLTDKNTLIAAVTARVSDTSSPAYQLEFKCDGQHSAVTLAAFDSAGQPRPIGWDSYYKIESIFGSFGTRFIPLNSARDSSGGVLTSAVGFSHRIDNLPAQSSILEKDRYVNAGVSAGVFVPIRQKDVPVTDIPKWLSGKTPQEVQTLFGKPTRGDGTEGQQSTWYYRDINGGLHSEVGVVHATIEFADGVVSRVAVESAVDMIVVAVDIPPSLPDSRLVVADLFPDETVSFRSEPDRRPADHDANDVFPAPARPVRQRRDGRSVKRGRVSPRWWTRLVRRLTVCRRLGKRRSRAVQGGGCE